MKTTIIIPAKGTSTRLKNKNLLKIGEKSLVYLACEKCLKVSNIDYVYLDSESQEVIDDVSALIKHGLRIIKRPKYLASNEYSGNDLIVYEQTVIEKSDLILHTYATSPLITHSTIESCIQQFSESSGYDSFFSAMHFQEYIWDNNGPINFSLDTLPNAIDLPKQTVVETHGLYGITDSALSLYKRRLGAKVLPIEIPRSQSLDINYVEDYRLLEVLWNQ